MLRRQFDFSPFTDEARKFYQKAGRFYSKIFLLFNRKEFLGLENKIVEGPNIIVTNHPSAIKEMFGPVKDVAAVFYAYLCPPKARQLSFLAESDLFFESDFRSTISKHLPLLIQKLFDPFVKIFVRFAMPRIRAIGTIPVYKSEFRGRKETREKIKEYLLKGRAVVFFQANICNPSSIHPYLRRFKKGAAYFAYEFAQKYKINIPVTPISVCGTEGFFRPFKKIIVNIGQSMSIESFMNVKNPVSSFTDALEERVTALLRESIEAKQIS